MTPIITHDEDAVARRLAKLPSERVAPHLTQELALVKTGAALQAQHLGRRHVINRNEADRLRGLTIDFPEETEVETHATLAKWLTPVLLFLAAAATVLNSISFQEIIANDVGRFAFAAFIVTLTGVTFHMFLDNMTARQPSMLFIAISGTALLVALAGQAYMAHMRADVIVEQVRQSIDASSGAAVESVDAPAIDDAARTTSGGDPVVERFLAAMQKAMVFLMIGLELAMGMLFHIITKALHNVPRRTYRRIRRLDAQDAELERDMQVHMAKNNLTELDLDNAQWRIRKRRDTARSPQMWIGIAIMVALLALIFGFATNAGAQTTLPQPVVVTQEMQKADVAVLLDLSKSLTQEDINQFVSATTRAFANPQLGQRFLVIGITDDAWANPRVLMEARVSNDPGFMNRTLMTAKAQLQKMWMTKAAALKPQYRDSDISGSITFAVHRLNAGDRRERPIRMYILSDMRQTRGVNIEQMDVIPFSAVDDAVRGRTFPLLEGTTVWVMGVNTRGKSQEYFDSLTCFWAGWFTAVRVTDVLSFDMDVDPEKFVNMQRGHRGGLVHAGFAPIPAHVK